MLAGPTGAAGDAVRKGGGAHDGREGFGVERGASHQGAVHVGHGKESGRVLGFDRSSVKDPQVPGEFLAQCFACFRPDELMGLGSKLWSCGFAGSDGPNWLVGDNQLAGFFPRDGVKGPQTLSAQDVFGEAGLAFLQNFADTHDWSQAGLEGSL